MRTAGLIDGGYFPISLTKDSVFPDWRGNCINVSLPSVDAWGSSPVIRIQDNDLVARAWSAWGVRLFGCGNGEVTVANNKIMCASTSPMGYAGGVQLTTLDGIGSNRNLIAGNTIQGTGGWAIDVDAFDVPCEANVFVGNDLTDFSAQEAGAVFLGPQANDNFLAGGVGAGVIDEGTGNTVVP